MIKVFLRLYFVRKKKKKPLSQKTNIIPLFFFNFRIKYRQIPRNEVSRIWDFWDLLKIEAKMDDGVGAFSVNL